MAADTIAAIATPPGRGGIGIVRASGPATPVICTSLLGVKPKPRYAGFHRFYAADGSVIDEGLALFFPAPHSFTGQDCLELQGHGGPVVMDLLLERVLQLGARLARPGEFTERAFLNNKLDLTQAEAVADLIDSSSVEAARAAINSLKGLFSKKIYKLVDDLIELRMHVESAIDFPEEDIDFLADENIEKRLHSLQRQLASLLGEAGQGQLLRDGMTVVIAGRPNVGKSSLLNRLSGYDAAIVTAVAGTTRDVLREHIHIDGMPLHIIDTAGLRHSENPVEQEGIRRAWNEIETADHLLVLLDDSIGTTAEDRALHAHLPENIPLTVVRNKIDLTTGQARKSECDWGTQICLSAKTGEGLDLLRRHLKDQMGYRSAGEGRFSARRRHLESLQRAAQCLQEAVYQLQHMRAGELVAEELRLAQKVLGEITGEFTSDDLLGRIFASFCIGK